MKNRLKKKDIVLMIIILVVAGSCMLLHRIIGEKSAHYGKGEWKDRRRI